MPDPQQKLVHVPDLGVVQFPGTMADEDVAAVLKTFTSSPDYKTKSKQTHVSSPVTGKVTEESEKARQTKEAQPLSTAIPDWMTQPIPVTAEKINKGWNQMIGLPGGVDPVQAEMDKRWAKYREGFDKALPVTAGVMQGASDFAQGMLTPENIMLSLGAPESKLLSAYFATQAMKGSYGSAKQAEEEFKKGNNKEAAQYATESLLGLGVAGLAGSHAVRGTAMDTSSLTSGPETIEGKFEKVGPTDLAPRPNVVRPVVEAMAKQTRTPKLADVKAEAGKLVVPKLKPEQNMTYYRGTNPGNTERITTGDPYWDSLLFVADSEKQAGNYGHSIEQVQLKPGSKILREGTTEFRKVAGAWRKGENMLQYASRSAKAAQAAGYDAIHFNLQGTIGTAILNRNAVDSRSSLADVKAKATAVQAYKPASQGEVLPPQGIEGLLSPDKRVQDDARATAKRKLTDLGFSESDYPAGGPQAPKTIEGEKPEVSPKTEQTTKYKFGNTQADIPQDSEAGQALATARTKIDKNDLMPSTNTTDGGGLEENSHITVRYGIDGEDTAGIKAYLEKQAPFEATLGKVTAFPPSEHSDGGAPIVVGIEAPELYRMEKEIDAHGNFTERSFPDYKPHATLGYVRPEAAHKYVGMGGMEGKKFTVNSVSISKKDGSIEEVPLKGKPAPQMPDIQKARTAEGKVKLGADAASLGKILGSSLYSGDSAKIITKELVQNALDAVRESTGPKNVTVEFEGGSYGQAGIDKRIKITDTGKGMTKNELETVFTDLGASGKREMAEASGGFGLAKAAPLMMSKQLEVSSVVKENGKKYIHFFTATPEELLGEGVTIHTEETSPDTPTGTTITSILPPNASFYGAMSHLNQSKLSLRSPGTLRVFENGIERGASNQAEIPSSPNVSTTIPGAKLDLYVSKSKSDRPTYKWGGITAEIHNNGIFQFTESIDSPEGIRGIPSRIAIDVRATVPEGDPDYPFLANRESLRSDARDALKKFVMDKVVNAAVESHQELVSKLYHNMPTLSDGYIPFFDSGNRLTPEEMTEIMQEPAMQQIGDAILGLTAQARNTLDSDESNLPYSLERMGRNVKRIGLVFSKEIHGVYITDPLDKSHATIFINPFDTQVHDPDEYASLIWHVIKHELIHDVVKGHSESFTTAEGAVSRALGKMEIKALNRLRGVYADPHDSERVRQDLDRALQIYQDSRGREETSPDIFGGEESRAELDKPGGEKDRGGRVQPSGEGTVPERRAAVRETPDRRQDAGQRKRISEMNADEMRKVLLTSDVVDLPNRRAFNEAELDNPSPAVARSDADALKAFNDKFGYANGDALLKAKADALKQADLDAYHEKGDEFLFRGESDEDLNKKFEKAREILRNTVFDVTLDDGTQLKLKGVDFSYGTGKDLAEAEANQHAHKESRERAGERKRGELRGITEVGDGENKERAGKPGGVTNPDITMKQTKNASPEDISRIEGKILEAIPSAKSANSLASGSPGMAVSKGLITREEAAQYSKTKGFNNEFNDLRVPEPKPPKERIGSEEADGDAPSVSWFARDNQDSGPVSDEQILRDYNSGKPALVYQSYIPLGEMPDPVLAEEENAEDDEEAGSYSWEDFGFKGGRGIPPMKVAITPHGDIEILDGNHRLKYWSDQGYDSIPAWVIDRRKGKIDGLSDDEQDKLDAIKKAAAKLKPTKKASVTVRDPDGYIHTFADEKSASAFRKAAGIE